jgi:CheY-like chemotaxis protein
VDSEAYAVERLIFQGQPLGENMKMNCAQSIRNRRDPDTRSPSGVESGGQKASKGLTALVVDDNPAILKLASAMLKKIGYNVHAVGEGTEALFHFHSSPCDLVLTDYELPAINGYQLGRKVKSECPGTRVVIMTGLYRSSVTGLMGDKNIDGWLFKPFYLNELKTLLERVGLPGGAVAESSSVAQTQT